MLIQLVYIKEEFSDDAVEYLVDLFVQEMDNYFNQSLNIWLIKFICFTVAMILGYFIIFARLLNQLKKEIWLAQGMLNLIPTSILLGNTELKSLVLKQKI